MIQPAADMDLATKAFLASFWRGKNDSLKVIHEVPEYSQVGYFGQTYKYLYLLLLLLEGLGCETNL